MDMPLKVLQISPYFPPYVGGSEGYCHQLSKRLAKQGHEVTVLTSRFHGDAQPDDSLEGFQVIRTLCFGEAWGVNPATPKQRVRITRSEEHTSELQSRL